MHAKGTVRGLARPRLIEARRALRAGWQNVADTLERQGETGLVSEVRTFVEQLPVVATDRQKLAIRFLQFRKDQERAKERHGMRRDAMERDRGRGEEMTR